MVIVKKVVHIISYIIYILIGIYALLCAPMLFGYKPLVVLSGSMEPTYKVGSVLYYKQVDIKELKVGDPITFKLDEGSIVSHRITKINANGVITKGDANNTVDPKEVKFTNILGRDAKLSIPFVGFYVKFINDHLFISIPIIAILILEFFLSNKNFDIDNEERSDDLWRMRRIKRKVINR